MIRRIIWILVFGFCLFLLLRRNFRALGFKPRNKEAEEEKPGIINGGEMIKDPFCQSYYPKNKAISKKIDGEIYYFCSEDCLKKFLGKREKEWLL